MKLGHLPAYTTKRKFVKTFSVLKNKTINELAHVFNSHSREGVDKTFFKKRKEVIHQQWLCSKSPQMTLSVVSDRRRFYVWECGKEIGFWKGTWLEQSTMKSRVIVLFIYHWSKNLATSKLWSEKLSNGHTTAVDWKKFLRENCAWWLLQIPKIVGGSVLHVRSMIRQYLGVKPTPGEFSLNSGFQ